MGQRIVMPLAAYRELANFAANQETRYYLKGICLEPSGIAIATDGHCLAARKIAAEDWHSSSTVDWIVPVDKAILRAKPTGSYRNANLWVVVERPDPASLAITLHAIAGGDAADAAELPRDRILAMAPATLIDGTFPAWRKVMPIHGRNESRAEYRALAEAVGRWEQEAPVNDEGLAAAQEALGNVAWHSLARPSFSPSLLGRICDTFTAGKTANPLVVRPGPTDSDPAIIEIAGRDDIVILLMPMRRPSDERYVTPAWAYTLPAPTQALAAD